MMKQREYSGVDRRTIVENQCSIGICSFKMYGDKRHEKMMRQLLGGQCKNCQKPLDKTIRCPHYNG
jgi:hypothetical protein